MNALVRGLVRAVHRRLPTKYKAALVQKISREYGLRLVCPYTRRGLRVLAPDDGVVTFLMTQGSYHEDREIEFVSQLLTRDSIAIDAGANVGFWTVVLADVFRNGCGRVYAFEPTPSTYGDLVANLALNGLDARQVATFQVGLGRAPGEFTLNCYDGPGGWNTFGEPQQRGVTGQVIPTHPIKVPVTTLDLWWEDAGRPACGFLKVDVEGYEEQVLSGGRALLEAHRADSLFLVLCEVNAVALGAAGSSAERVYSQFDRMGYRAFRLRWAPPSVPILDAIDQQEFSNIASENVFLLPLSSALLERINAMRWDVPLTAP